MRRSVLVKVPSFSSEGEAGRTTSANRAVSENETVLHDEEIEHGKSGFHVIRVGVGGDRVLALDVHAFELALVDGANHLVIVETVFGGSLTPQPASNFCRIASSSTG